jgi:uncharacterized protein YbjQ (UPF0145 family)
MRRRLWHESFVSNRIVKKRLSRLFALSFVTTLASCASQDFHQYTGVQQNWPIASGTFVSTKYGVPAYYGPPNRPYIVLGSLDATTVRGIGQDAESAVQDAARVAKRMGADAVVVIGSGRERVGTGSFATASTNSNYTGGFKAAAVGNGVYGRAYGSGSSTTNIFGSSFGSYQGKASVLVIKFK